MKLYNLFEEIILEETEKLLLENVSDQQVIDAIKNKYHVHILYDDYPDAVPSVAPSKRYIEVYNLGVTTAGNKAIRAWQMGGPSKTVKGAAWKIFRLDRIRAWMPTKVKWKQTISNLYPNNPNIPKYNDSNGGSDKSMIRLIAKADISQQVPQPQPTKAAPKKDDRIEKLQKLSQMRHKKQNTSKTTASGIDKTAVEPNNDKIKR